MAADWAGIWETDFGDMTLHVHGQVLSGSYEPCHGTIQGTVAGDVATGIWRQSFSERGGLPWGSFRVVRDGNGSFSGHWSYGRKGNAWDGTWQGKKRG
jgi:hypothetical protein